MDFDKLNQRIAILEHRTVVDEIGNHTSKWDEVFPAGRKVSLANDSMKEAVKKDSNLCEKRDFRQCAERYRCLR